MHDLLGYHHVCIPSTDPLTCSAWYLDVLWFKRTLVEEEDAVDAVLLMHRAAFSCIYARHQPPLKPCRA